MSNSISEHLGPRRNTVKERVICRELRSMGESPTLAAIEEFLISRESLPDYPRHKLALQLANWVLRERRSFLRLLDLGCSTADLSTAEFWIVSLVPRIGARRFLNRLIAMSGEQPEFVEAIRYWVAGRHRELLSIHGSAGPGCADHSSNFSQQTISPAICGFDAVECGVSLTRGRLQSPGW
jgi:hypothetical protein